MVWRKIIAAFVMAAFFCFPSHAETNNQILLSIDGKPVSVDEFNYYYAQTASEKRLSPEGFLNRFLNFKLKVSDARRQRWDTLPDFRLQCSLLQGKALERYLAGSDERSVVRSPRCGNGSLHFWSGKWVKVEYISLFLPQRASAVDVRKARQSIDSVYHALRGGASFRELSLLYDSGTTHKYPADGWMPLDGMLNEFSDCLRLLKRGEFSSPFSSPLGFHIIRLVDSRNMMGPEEALPAIRTLLECEGAGSPVVDRNRFSAWRENGGSASGGGESGILERIEDELLAAYWDERNVFAGNGDVSDEELENYFNAHKQDYVWDLPHFKGGVIHCLDRKAASRLKRKLKRVPLSRWKEEVRNLAREDGRLKAEVETGLFQIGTNEYVDRLAFRCGDFIPKPELPYTFVIGRRLKKGPDDYSDVEEEVKRDYLEFCEEERLKDLKNQFFVEINQDVLKTVNCSGSE